MPDPVRTLARLFRWGAWLPSNSPAVEVSYGPETEVAVRFQALLESESLRAPGRNEEELRARLLPAAKRFIHEERGRIEASHRGGAGGLEVVARLADLVDAVVCQFFRLAEGGVPGPLKAETEGCAVVALGGYGRRELNPASDVDLMILYPRHVDAYVTAILNQVLYVLWDLGFSVGHSCRSLADAVQMMDQDITTRTSMLEARFLAGTPQVFLDLHHQTWRNLQGRRALEYIEGKTREQAQRHKKYGGSIFLQEPNVKEGPGGLRDFHTAIWVARARHHLEDLKALVRLGLLSPVELAQCLHAVDSLLRVRSELHYLHAGKSDILSLSVQVPVAANLGFRDDTTYGVERFMQQYYTWAATVHRFSRYTAQRLT